MKKVLLVDGSRAGAVLTVADGTRRLAFPVLTNLEGEYIQRPIEELMVLAPWDLGFKQATYHFETCSFFGHYLTIGTVKGRSDVEDVLEVLLSDEAKEALS